MRLFLGFFLIFIGAIYLGYNTNLINSDQLFQIIQFWPILFIIFGGSLLFHHIKYGWIATLILIFFSAVFVYTAISGKLTFINVKSPNQKTSVSHFSSSLVPSVKKADISIDFGAVDMRMDSTSDGLIKGELRSNYLESELNVEQTDDTINATLKTITKSDFWLKGKNDMTVKLTNKIPVNLTLNAGASKIDLDLDDIILSGLKINSGATDIKFSIGNKIENNSIIEISSGASKIDLDFPENIGVRIKNQSPLSSLNFDDFTKIDSKTYESENFSQADKKIELRISSGVSDIKVSVN